MKKTTKYYMVHNGNVLLELREQYTIINSLWRWSELCKKSNPLTAEPLINRGFNLRVNRLFDVLKVRGCFLGCWLSIPMFHNDRFVLYNLYDGLSDMGIKL